MHKTSNTKYLLTLLLNFKIRDSTKLVRQYSFFSPFFSHKLITKLIYNFLNIPLFDYNFLTSHFRVNLLLFGFCIYFIP